MGTTLIEKLTQLQSEVAQLNLAVQTEIHMAVQAKLHTGVSGELSSGFYRNLRRNALKLKEQCQHIATQARMNEIAKCEHEVGSKSFLRLEKRDGQLVNVRRYSCILCGKQGVRKEVESVVAEAH